MKDYRKIAVAAATVSALSLAGTPVAFAQDQTDIDTNLQTDQGIGMAQFFGSSAESNKSLPVWGSLLKWGGLASVIATVIGGVIAAINSAMHSGIITHR